MDLLRTGLMKPAAPSDMSLNPWCLPSSTPQADTESEDADPNLVSMATPDEICALPGMSMDVTDVRYDGTLIPQASIGFFRERVGKGSYFGHEETSLRKCAVVAVAMPCAALCALDELIDSLRGGSLTLHYETWLGRGRWSVPAVLMRHAVSFHWTHGTRTHATTTTMLRRGGSTLGSPSRRRSTSSSTPLGGNPGSLTRRCGRRWRRRRRGRGNGRPAAMVLRQRAETPTERPMAPLRRSARTLL